MQNETASLKIHFKGDIPVFPQLFGKNDHTFLFLTMPKRIELP